MGSCGGCNVCEDKCSGQCCNASCLMWGFDDCYLRGRCPDGTELDPLNLCAWLKVHETCTDFRLVPDSSAGGYMQFTNECDEVEKIYICDFLGLGELECIGNVYDRDPAKPCDLLVFDPSCGDPENPHYNKWSHYTIPDAGSCVMETDENGYFKVLRKNDCGCIEECKLFAQSMCWEYALRDSWPDDPDWPFSYGSYNEVIDLQLERVPAFNQTDLEVTVQYAFGIQNHVFGVNRNYKSTATPTSTNTMSPPLDDIYTKAMVVQGCNLDPWGSWEWQVSRTFLIPKGQKLFLAHEVLVHDVNGNVVPAGDTTGSSRLHALHVFVKTARRGRL